MNHPALLDGGDKAMLADRGAKAKNSRKTAGSG
jgi:hypothetical protein